MSSTPLDVLFVWHFHQPYYRVPGNDEFALPWVRLHSVKSYYDMARLLEKRPAIRSTFNFSGSLLRQLVEMADGMRDRWWRWSKTDPDDLELAERRAVVRHFFSLNHERGIGPLPRYRELLALRSSRGIASCAETFSRQDFLDLQVLFNLAWCGFSARQDFPIIEQLRKKGRDFDTDDLDALLEVHELIVSKILPLYGDLAKRDQIEISVTPIYHPIVPLLIDTDVAARATPHRPRPPRYQAPEDARFHISEGLDLAQAAFGYRPRGMWPSEGSVSPEAYELFAEAGLSWIATDEDVLRCSRGNAWNRDIDLWRPWTLGDGDGPRMFFRDHGLSDQIGFVYSNNIASDAVEDLLGHLTAIRRCNQGRPAQVSIILDGENPWEHYPDDGRHFLETLYTELEAHSELRTNIPSGLSDMPAGRLDRLHSGSWIMANYQIWIGHEETNRAWDWVRRASERIDDIAAADPNHPGLSQAREALHIAQGSDWFWWYGDDFSSEEDDQFDALFRALISGVWRFLGDRPPPELGRPIHRHIDEAEQEAHITPQRRFISPTIDGTTRDFFDWIGAGQILVAGGHGSMYETYRPLTAILFGFSRDQFFIRLEPGADFSHRCRFRVHLHTDERDLEFIIGPNDQESDIATLAFDQVGELAITLEELDIKRGDSLQFWVAVHRDGLQVQRFPTHEAFALEVPRVDPGKENWLV